MHLFGNLPNPCPIDSYKFTSLGTSATNHLNSHVNTYIHLYKLICQISVRPIFCYIHLVLCITSLMFYKTIFIMNNYTFDYGYTVDVDYPPRFLIPHEAYVLSLGYNKKLIKFFHETPRNNSMAWYYMCIFKLFGIVLSL